MHEFKVTTLLLLIHLFQSIIQQNIKIFLTCFSFFFFNYTIFWLVTLLSVHLFSGEKLGWGTLRLRYSTEQKHAKMYFFQKQMHHTFRGTKLTMLMKTLATVSKWVWNLYHISIKCQHAIILDLLVLLFIKMSMN